MDSTLPPDPYKALGVAKDADQAVIKSTYRKLALRCHPDKVTDEALKPQAQEQFHRIQQAYELIGEESKRDRYDAEVRLETLRREKAARTSGSSAPEVRTSRYETRTQAPAGATFSSTTAHRYDDRKASSRTYEVRPDKYDTYDPYPSKHTSAPRSREKEIPIKVTRVSTDRTRSDHKKSRDKEDRRERDRRFVSVESESSADEKKRRYEDDYKRRSDDARRAKEEDDLRREAAAAREKAEERRVQDEKHARIDRERSRKTNDQASEAVRYIHRTMAEGERPSPSRTTSSRDVRPEYYTRESRSRRSEPAPRRSSARPKDRTTTSGRDRDRKDIHIVDWDDKPPSFKHSNSSPADIHVSSRAVPQRSYTESSRDHRHADTSPPPAIRRADTMPVHSSSRRKEATSSRPSTLRESVTPHASAPNSPEKYPTVPPPKTTYYTYTTPGGGVRLTPEDVNVANGHRTVVHEPSRHRTHSPTAPLPPPPMGANRPVEVKTSYTTAAPKASMVPPPLGRSATVTASPIRTAEPERGRTRLYGEVSGSESLRRENARRQTNFSPDQVSYSVRPGPEDIRWAPPRDSTRDREYAKPSLNRHTTSVF